MSSEYRSYNESMMGMMPQYPYYPSYYPTQGDFPSSLSPSSTLEESKSHLKLGSDLVHPSHYMPSSVSPMNSTFEFNRGLDHRIARPPYSQFAYGEHRLPQEEHFRTYSSEMAGPGSSELRGRAENWTYEETRTFVRLLMEHASEFQNIRRHPGLWSMLANRMVQHGFPRTVEKCKNRWKVLVAKYKRCHTEMQRQQNSKFSSTDKNLLILNDGSNPAAQTSQGFEFFYQMETLLKPNYHIGSDGVQRRFRTAPIEMTKRPTPPAITITPQTSQDVQDSHPEPSTPITPMPPINYYSQYSLPQYTPLLPSPATPYPYHPHY